MISVNHYNQEHTKHTKNINIIEKDVKQCQKDNSNLGQNGVK